MKVKELRDYIAKLPASEDDTVVCTGIIGEDANYNAELITIIKVYNPTKPKAQTSFLNIMSGSEESEFFAPVKA